MATTPTRAAAPAPVDATSDGGAAAAVQGPLTRVEAINGTIQIKASKAVLQSVDIADVDLLLTFSDGQHVVIANGALDALSSNAPDAVFSNEKVNLSELFKMVGVARVAQSGSLRLVSENIDANPPPAVPEEAPLESNAYSPAPAPIIHVSPSMASGKLAVPGNGGGAGDGPGEVAAVVAPPNVPLPAVFRSGHTTQTVSDLLSGIGQPLVTQSLYTSSEFKVTPSGRTDLPLGAYDPAANSVQLEVRASAAAQATREVINGTSGDDTIGFNTAFSAGAEQWSKTLHVTATSFSGVTSIQFVFNAAKIALIPGFDLQGTGVTRDSPTSNSWHVTPTADMLLTGFDVHLVYNVTDAVVTNDFSADLIVQGLSGVLKFEVINNLNFTYRNAVSVADFTVTSSTGDPLMVLPSGGVGVEIFAGDGNDNVFGGAGPDLIHGGNGNDTLSGGTGNDVLDGGAGADAMDGGQGIDTATYEYANAGVGVVASLDTSLGVVNTGEAAGDTYLNVENLRGTQYADTLIGDAQANLLEGGAGNDILIGRGGSDTLDGGDGTDTASYQYDTFGVTVNLTTGTGSGGEADGDKLISIENLTGGLGNDTLIGDAGVNVLDGGPGNNTLEGMGGADVLIGGTGTDTVSYAHASAGVVSSLTTSFAVGPTVVQAGDAAGDTYTSIENMLGSAYDDTLIGNTGANVINGGNGNDTLEGLGGGDTLIGGSGFDTASFAHATVGVTASLTTSFAAGPAVTQTGDAANDTYSSIENLTGSGQNDTLIGDGNVNVLDGGLGDDVLEGMGGADVLIGGIGTDTASYAHALTGVAASLTPSLAGFSAGGDAAGDTYDSIENLTGSGFADTLIGNSGANVLDGGAGDDVMEGLGGGDTYIGGTGKNTVSYEHAPDQGAGLGVVASLVNTAAVNTGYTLNDTYSNIQNLTGSAFDDVLAGDANDNVLIGGDGNDTLTGGLGVDTLSGGNGNDIISDGLEGAARIDAGAGDDTISITSDDNVFDLIDGGAGTDTLIWAYAGSQRVDVNMYTGTVNYYGPVGGTYTNFSNIENFTAAGTNNAYVYANNQDNILVGGSTANDWLDYRYALAGVNINLATGVVTGGSGNDTVTGFEHIYMGSNYNDVLTGDANNNIIRGGPGADVLDGAGGIDTWLLDWYNTSTTASLLTAQQNTLLGIVMTGDAAGDTVSNFENITANYGDLLYGNAVANVFTGRGSMEGFLGADVFNGTSATLSTVSYADAGNHDLAVLGITAGDGVGVTVSLNTSLGITYTGDAFGDTFNGNINNLTGSAYADILVGNANANVLDGGAGDDILEGLGGADIFKGGAGVDTVSYAHAASVSGTGLVVDLSNSGSFTQTGDAAGDQFFGIENITGSNFNDILHGDGNNNVLDGGTGTNTLDGGAGIDTVSYASASAGVTITLLAGGGGTGGSVASGRSDTFISIEQVIGSKFVDTITGTSGNDWIDGGAGGADIINGGLGTDTISYASSPGAVGVVLNTSSTDGKILSNFENIYGSASASGDNLKGDALNNVIEGNLGDDTLDGGANSAVVLGSSPGDTVSYSLSSAAVTVNISGASVVVALAGAAAQTIVTGATGGEGNDTLLNFEAITGSAFNDILIGDGNSNTIDGGNGDDYLMGGAGADALIGGNGTDTVSYANAGGAVTVTINGTGTQGDANGDILTGIENLIGSAFNDTLTGDGNDNMFDGGLGANTINGGAGIDTIDYRSATSGMNVNLNSIGANAVDTLVVHLRSDTLTLVENIIGSNFADTLIGNGVANVIEGGGGADTLSGFVGTKVNGGLDTASYAHSGAGVVVSLVAGAANTGGDAQGDVLTNFANLIGSAFDDRLTGDQFDNSLSGGDGNDVLIGGLGNDKLDGGNGNNTASYANSTVGVNANLYTGVASGEGNDTFTNIQNLIGSNQNDTLVASNNYAGTLVGGGGNDTMSVGAASSFNYTFDVTSGRDTATGSNGDDVFKVNAVIANGAAPLADLPTLVNGNGNTTNLQGGGDTIQLIGLTSSPYSLTALANVTANMEILNMRDGVNTRLDLASLDVRNYVDGGNGSQMWIKADSGDSINIGLVAGETQQVITVSGNATDYLVFNAAGTQVAQIHWQTA